MPSTPLPRTDNLRDHKNARPIELHRFDERDHPGRRHGDQRRGVQRLLQPDGHHHTNCTALTSVQLSAGLAVLPDTVFFSCRGLRAGEAAIRAEVAVAMASFHKQYVK